MDAEVIAIGDEIVGGQHVDSNSTWLSQRLEELGWRVRYHTAVGDEPAFSVKPSAEATWCWPPGGWAPRPTT